MTPENYEKAMLANAAYRLAYMDDLMEMTAICCVIRNHVLPRLGMAKYKSFTDAIEDFFCLYPTRTNPPINSPLLAGKTGLLSIIDSIYDCTYADVTASHNNVLGARYFARVQSLPPDDWRYAEVVSRPGLHPLIGSFGSQAFYQ